MSNQQVHYRQATELDCPEMVRVHYAAVQALASNHYADEVLAAWSPLPDEVRFRWLAGVLAQHGVFCTVAALPNHQLVGFVIFSPEQSLLRAIYVHPDQAGCGIGRGLLELAEAQCAECGVVNLCLNASYNAEPFYASCGYQAVGATTYPLTEAVSMGAIRMVKPLAWSGYGRTHATR